MFSLVKQIYVEYHLFIVKMHIESAKSVIVLKNLNASCGIELIWGSPVSYFCWTMCMFW